MEIFFKTEEKSILLSTNKTQVVELRGLTVDEVESTIKFYNGLKAARELNKELDEVK
ncbi:hypothetical protein [Lactococcus formosensis]|uniref:hypothetical protein n=1 Tax=Lactococcus formosensis TaxID=1281486 RepID=UPI002435210E|nr:hypothetical protein [Lactococcus formosensis]MDG6113764.1 hypothetical protein [Lactococcus formosensis]MDG6122245.1 hypothetical protein [Lactococcus formosensis]MDG6151851.1 hypothetical protein [Lactococcus formosensis]MDG6174929.1 hypothetical protein [Lactococcus formosensis]MDG6181247.1 hypothetical protein [Lactococcus formosensis]